MQIELELSEEDSKTLGIIRNCINGGYIINNNLLMRFVRSDMAREMTTQLFEDSDNPKKMALVYEKVMDVGWDEEWEVNFVRDQCQMAAEYVVDRKDFKNDNI